MGLTINDVEKISFPGGFFGYRRAVVEDFRADVVETLQEMVDEMARLKKEMELLKSELDKYRATEKLLQESVILAQKSHDEIVAAARQEAQNILQEARLKAVELSRELGTLSAERERFAYEFHALLKGFLERLEQTQPELASGIVRAAPGAVRAEPSQVAEPSTERAAPEERPQPPTAGQPSGTESESPFPEEQPR